MRAVAAEALASLAHNRMVMLAQAWRLSTPVPSSGPVQVPPARLATVAPLLPVALMPARRDWRGGAAWAA
jgi:hypothetical protein